MAIKTKEGDIDVVTAAELRIENVLSKDLDLIVSISGGKDSICMANLVYEKILKGVGNPKRITVQFVDEEAMFDDVIEIVKDWRQKFLLAGCNFEWYCVEVKHYNCLNTLEEKETFVLWDRFQKDKWVRPMPDFKVITDDKYLIPRKDNYQSFLTRKNMGKVVMQGVRANESIQRRKNFALLFSSKGGSESGITNKGFFFPIYDWTDRDVWRYIRDKNLNFPKTYMNMYQIGTPINRLRISQFFSIDTAKSLVQMNEFEPDLMDRVIRREPNAYLAMLYWDTELFRHSRKKEKGEVEEDYQKKVQDLFKNKDFFNTEEKKRLARKYGALIMRHGMIFNDRIWRNIYNAMVGGDPKDRTYRAIAQNIYAFYTDKVKEELGVNKVNIND